MKNNDVISLKKSDYFLVNSYFVIRDKIKEYKSVFISCFVFGFVAHAFFILNKIPNHDDVRSLFNLGTTVTSGRWGLELFKLLGFNVSVPWLYGLTNILLIAISVCIMCSVVKIKEPVLQFLLGAVFVSASSIVDIFTYMFTSCVYMIALFCSVIAIYLIKISGVKNLILSVILMMLSVSLYQTMITMSCGLFLLLMMGEVMDENQNIREYIKKIFIFLIVTSVALCTYYLINTLFLILYDAELGEYATDRISFSVVDLFGKIVNIYKIFIKTWFYGHYGVTVSRFGVLCYDMLSIVLAVLCVFTVKSLEVVINKVLFVLGVILLPLAMNCIYLVVKTDVLSTRMFLSLIYGLLFIAMLVERLKEKRFFNVATLIKNLSTVLLLGISVSNMIVANHAYFLLYISDKQVFSFYSTVVTQIKSMPEFKENSKVAFIGKTDKYIPYFYRLNYTKEITGVSSFDANIYSKEQYIINYIGFDVKFASEEEISKIKNTKKFVDMSVYPYNNSISNIDDFIVVKLGNE